mmetsp:Transcript_6234/g.7683  ORF Transcript_6234/g.7683 Transcript_6234/m.7683 type:complete len:257 (-) Transcript_6234:284-1054(-)
MNEILRSVTYNNIDDDPDPSTRQISWECTDDSNLTSDQSFTRLVINPQNDLLTIDLNGASAGTGHTSVFTEDQGPVEVTDFDVDIVDVDNENIIECTLQLASTPDGTDESLDMPDTVGISHVYDAATRTLTLSGAASESAYESALASVVYNNIDHDPDTTTRNVAVQCTGQQNSSSTADIVVIIPVNDAPKLDLNSSDSKRWWISILKMMFAFVVNVQSHVPIPILVLLPYVTVTPETVTLLLIPPHLVRALTVLH